MAGHQSKVPPLAYEYFKRFGIFEHPVIRQFYRPGKGWKYYPIKKRVSLSELRMLRREGVEKVQLSAGGHIPDFGIDELLRSNAPGGYVY